MASMTGTPSSACMAAWKPYSAVQPSTITSAPSSCTAARASAISAACVRARSAWNSCTAIPSGRIEAIA